MPSSQIENISTITQWIADLKPKSILDVGVGFGKYGALAREYTDIRNGRYCQSHWQTIIDGIEIFGGYENPLWKIYDQIYLNDARLIIPNLRNYELILLCDILEHFEKDQALLLLKDCLSFATRAVIVSTPSINFPQGQVNGNIFESHLSVWGADDFKDGLIEVIGPTISVLYLKKEITK